MQRRILAGACLVLATLTTACGSGASVDAGGADLAQAARKLPKKSTPTTIPSGGTATTVSIPTGRLLASNCFQCHGTNGVSAGGFDSLAGESVSEILEELKEMQVAVDEDEGIMRPHALGYTDAQIRSLAAYFASQRKP